MGCHVLNSSEIWDRKTIVIIQFLMNGKMHIHCVCGGSESEYASGWKDFILGPRLEEGDNKFSVFFTGGTENFLSSLGGTDVFQHIIPILGANPW